MIIILAYFLFWILFIVGIIKIIKWAASGRHTKPTPSEKIALSMMIMDDK